MVAEAGARLTCVVVGFLYCAAVGQTPLGGRVTDPSGKPLADVRVTSWFSEEVRTDDLGQFKLPRPSELIRFSKEGQQPLTIATESITDPLVLHPATLGAWKPPACPRSGVARFGGLMLFATPQDTRLDKQADVDYRTVSIQYVGAWLVFGTGIHWTYGLPHRKTLTEMIKVDERDVQTPWGSLAAEYRGRRADGSRWREIIMFGESIEYDRASAKAAAYFDQIIDSMCFTDPR
jgi:hypothetical protein